MVDSYPGIKSRVAHATVVTQRQHSERKNLVFGKLCALSGPV
jgi:hypothetical protein